MPNLWDVIRNIAVTAPFALIGAAMIFVLILIGTHQQMYFPNGIKPRTVGDGQHGTARWATAKEGYLCPRSVRAREMARGRKLPVRKTGPHPWLRRSEEQGHGAGGYRRHPCAGHGSQRHGQNRVFLYPISNTLSRRGGPSSVRNTEGDLFRNYAGIVKDCYGYHNAILDLRDRSYAEGKCWPGIKRIAADLYLSRSTVKRAPDDLERAGFVERQERRRENGSQRSNLYTILAEPKAST